MSGAEVRQARDGLARAYDEALVAADALYRALERRLVMEREAERPDPDIIGTLESDRVAVTELVDLLESAVALSVARLTDRDARRRRVGR